MRAALRVARALGVLLLGLVIVLPNFPKEWLPELLAEPVSTVAGWTRQVSVVQSWKMYAPNPQRAHSYMNLTAHYEDGTTAELEETLQERDGWTTHFAWDKTRHDIWRHYANFHPKRSNEHRKWYLRGVCIREARKGRMPDKIVMEQVSRRFAPPDKVAEGHRGLGQPRKRLVTVAYCKVKRVRQMIDEDPVLSAAG